MKRFFVSPCDEDNGRTWDVCERIPRVADVGQIQVRCVRSGITKRIKAREICRLLNEGKDAP